MAFDADQNRLTLQRGQPYHCFFTDRPERIAGNMKTTSFVPFWSTGKDSFLSDPPNADIRSSWTASFSRWWSSCKNPVSRVRT